MTMKKLFIWWHRRRAVANKAKEEFHNMAGHLPTKWKFKTYAMWHEKQIERLSQ
jgi:hypothetical protein